MKRMCALLSLITLLTFASLAKARDKADGKEPIIPSIDTPNHFGGADVYWAGTVSRGNSNVYSLFKINYPGAAKPAATQR